MCCMPGGAVHVVEAAKWHSVAGQASTADAQNSDRDPAHSVHQVSQVAVVVQYSVTASEGFART
jgi:hypothetical protein